MANPKIAVDITGDAARLKRAFGEASRSAGGFGSAMSKAGKIAAVGFAAGIGLAAIGMKKAVSAASDLNEQVNKASVVFGKSGKEVVKWSSGLARSFGLSSRAALEAAGNFGNMLVPMGFSRTEAAGMSKKMVELAGDLASFNNVPVPDALEKIRAGLAGESEPLRTMGVFLSDARVKAEAMAEGLYKGKGPLEASAKAAATYALILKDTKDAQGDFAKTNDGLANAQRSIAASWENISASLGAKFLPAIAGVASGVADFMDKLSKADGASAKFNVVVDEVKTIATKTWTSLKAAFNAIQWGQIWDTVKARFMAVDWNQTARDVGERIIKAFNNLSAAIARVDWNKVGQAMGDGIKRAAAVLANVDWGTLIVSYMKLQALIVQALAKVMVALGKSLLQGLAGVLQRAASDAGQEATKIGQAILQGIVSGLSGLAGALASALLAPLESAYNKARSFLQIKSPSQMFATGVGQPMGEGVVQGWITGTLALPEKISDTLRKAVEKGAQTVEAARSRFTDAWSTLAGDAMSAFDAQLASAPTRAEKALKKLQEVHDAKGLQQGLADAKQALRDAGDDPAAQLAAERQIEEAKYAIKVAALQKDAAAQRVARDAENALRRRHFETALNELGVSLAKHGATAAAATKAVLKLMRSYHVDFADVGAEAGKAFVRGLKEALEAAASRSGALKGTISNVAAGISPTARAGGGPVTGGRPYVVGERGPELFVPGQNGSIVPNGAGGGSTINVTVNGWVGNDQQIAERVHRELVRYGKRNTTIFTGTGVVA